MIEKVIEGTIQQIPALVIFAAALLYFIRMGLASMERMFKRCHEVQDASAKTISKNTEVLTTLVEVVRKYNGPP
jgi:hypothetical protein